MVELEICPKCNHKSLRFRGFFNPPPKCSAGTYFCNHCRCIFDKEKKFLNHESDNIQFTLDEYGNKYDYEIKKGQGRIIEIKTYFLEPGKTTLKTEHPKLESKKCLYPKRLSCNYGIGFKRCPYMKYKEGRWNCIVGLKNDKH